MASKTVPVVHELIERASALKGQLVAFACGPRMAKHLSPLLVAEGERHGDLDEGRAVMVVDHFALQHRLPDGRTVVERFVERSGLSDDDKAMLLGWRDVVEGCFEVGRFSGDALELHNLVDDVVYRVRSNVGRTALAQLRSGTFAICRIVPLHPDSADWLVSGHISTLPRSSRKVLAKIALDMVTAHPEQLRRNPALYNRAWEMQAEQRAEFVAQVGSDLVVLPPHEAQETMREHYRRLQRKAAARQDGRARGGGMSPEDMVRWPADLLDAESVALIYDEVEGLGFYRDFSLLDALFADPQAADRVGLARLRHWLDDDSIPPMVIRRLVERHPDGADAAFRAALRKPDFSWTRDGEKLLRRTKGSFMDREPAPSVSVVGKRLLELLRP